MSLIEAVIALGIIGVVLGVAGMIAQTGSGAFESTSSSLQLDAESRRVTDRLVSELTGLSSTMMFPDPDLDGAETVTFQTPVGFVDGAPVDGPVIQLSMEYDAGEIDDGVDNDDDGLVDECALVLTRDPGGVDEMRAVLSNSVAEFLDGELLNGEDDNGNQMPDEGGFCVQRIDDLLIIRVSFVGLDADGEQVTDTIEVFVESREEVE